MSGGGPPDAAELRSAAIEDAAEECCIPRGERMSGAPAIPFHESIVRTFVIKSALASHVAFEQNQTYLLKTLD